MTDDELRRLCREGATLALDSNVVFGRGLLDLADLVNRLNESDAPELRLVIPALVHGEHLLQEQETRGGKFQLAKALMTLQQKNVAVVAYEQSDAEDFATWMHNQFPTPEARYGARWTRLLGPSAEPKTTKCPATTDWHIAGQARARRWVCVTDDGGGEFAGLERKCGSEQLRRVLSALAPESRAGQNEG